MATVLKKPKAKKVETKILEELKLGSDLSLTGTVTVTEVTYQTEFEE